MLIAATSKGICRLTFDDSEASLRRLFPKATIVKDAGGMRELVDGALAAIEKPLAAPRPADRRRRHRVPGGGLARAEEDSGWRNAQLCRRLPPRSAIPRPFAQSAPRMATTMSRC